MTRYLLDTNILSAITREPRGRLARKVQFEPVCTSIICVAEIRYGYERVRAVRQLAQFETIISSIDVVKLETPADEHYAVVRSNLERRGLLIGANDLFIAAHVLALDMTLVTDNTDEFRRVVGLRVENWLRSDA